MRPQKEQIHIWDVCMYIRMSKCISTVSEMCVYILPSTFVCVYCIGSCLCVCAECTPMVGKVHVKYIHDPCVHINGHGGEEDGAGQCVCAGLLGGLTSPTSKALYILLWYHLTTLVFIGGTA